MFLPSQSTALLALEVSPWLALDVMARRALRPQAGNHLDSLADRAEPKLTDAELQLACTVLGEQFIGLLAMIAHRNACHEEGRKFAVIEPRGEFGLPFENLLANHLQLSRSHPRYGDLLLGLAVDFRAWVGLRPPELTALGLEDTGGEGVVVTCKALAPVLTSLPD